MHIIFFNNRETEIMRTIIFIKVKKTLINNNYTIKTHRTFDICSVLVGCTLSILVSSKSNIFKRKMKTIVIIFAFCICVGAMVNAQIMFKFIHIYHSLCLVSLFKF